MDKLTAALLELDRQRALRRAEDLEIERLTALAEGLGGVGYGSDAPRGSTSGDRLERGSIDLSEYKTAVKRDRRARALIRFTALSIIWTELEPAAAYVAEAMTDRGLTVDEIATELGYSKSWIYAQGVSL